MLPLTVAEQAKRASTHTDMDDWELVITREDGSCLGCGVAVDDQRVRPERREQPRDIAARRERPDFRKLKRRAHGLSQERDRAEDRDEWSRLDIGPQMGRGHASCVAA